MAIRWRVTQFSQSGKPEIVFDGLTLKGANIRMDQIRESGGSAMLEAVRQPTTRPRKQPDRLSTKLDDA